MPKSQSLDELISRKAAEFAEHVRNAAKLADNEEEIKMEVEKQLAFIQKEAGVELDKKYEFTLASGRADAVYTRVIIEYKNPSSTSDRVGPKPDSPGTKKVVAQIKSRFHGMRDEHGHPFNSLFGVGLDGLHFVFVRFREGKWDVQDPVEVTRYSTERFLWALFNLGHKGKPFSPEYLAGDFGAQEGSLATAGIHALYEAIASTDNPKAQTFFSQWKILFGEVCGYDVDDPSDKIKKLAAFYNVGGRNMKPAELLFAVHTYYAIFMKLLAAEIVAFFHRLPTPLEKINHAGTSNKLKQEMEELEAGSIFRHLNITNFLEGDLFAWYTSVWTEPIEQLVRKMAARLDDYNPGTLSEEPASSRDLLKKLCQQLFPKSVRHDLGEYYTPDWLAEHVLNELEYIGDPDKRVLDPACGSGTFLVMAINRIRAWYEENRERCDYDEGELCRKILTNVIGIDLNPLAVMAARTNYLIGIRDLIGHSDKVEIPIYLCDSILTPSEYGGLFSGGRSKFKELKTAASTFVIPTEIAGNREDVAKYAEQLEFGVRNGYSPAEFLQRCHDEGLPTEMDRLHTDLYKDLVKLDKANKNGVWARIIKNAFAPLFIGAVDYVVGNPPWVNWESLPKDYRDTTVSLWDKYRLRERATPGARLGNVKKELSVLFVYVAMEHYVRDGGKLGFLITQSIFKSGENEGFRRFAVSAKRPFCAAVVSDLSLLLPFENAINRTAIVIIRNGEKTKYPAPYRLWVPAVPRSTVAEADLLTVQQGFKIRDWLAAPIEPSIAESTWLTAPSKAFPVLRKIAGDRDSATMDRTYAGSCTWLNGVFWVECVRASDRSSLIRNLGDVGRSKVETVTVQVENEFLFPLLRGRDVRAWYAKPSATVLVPHDKEDFGQPVSLAVMKQKYPKTFAFFKTFEQPLRKRSGYKQLHKSRPEFYVVGNVGNYTLASYKVVFKELTEIFQCAVLGPHEGQPAQTVVPDHKLAFLTVDNKNEAFFLAGLLNSVPTRVALYCASVGLQTQTYSPTDVSRIRLPEFKSSNKVHQEVVRLAKSCHQIASCEGDTFATEVELAQACGAIWDISHKDLDYLLEAYNELQGFRSRRTARETAADDEGVE